MKIAYVCADTGIPVFGNKGASVHVWEMANAFSNLGHKVTIFAASVRNSELPKGVEIIKVVPENFTPSSMAVNADFNGDKEDIVLKERRSLNAGAATFDLLLRTHLAGKFDFIYERYSLWSTSGLRAARKLGIPFLLEVNAPLLEEQKKYRQLVLESDAEAITKEVFTGADAVFTVSEELKKYVTSMGAIPVKTFIMANGVNLNKFAAAKSTCVENVTGKFVLGFAGSLKPWHGIEILLDAFKQLSTNYHNYHLLVVGDGPLRGWLEGYAHGAGIDNKVTVTGWIDHDKYPGLLQSMDIAIAPYPYMEDFYFSPLKLFEYMAAGKPVIASDIGQIREIIDNGINGILVKPGDTEELVEKIEFLRNVPNLMKKLGNKARIKASNFTWENNAQRIFSVLHELQSQTTGNKKNL